RLGHVDRHEPAHLLGIGGVALLLARLAEEVEVPLEHAQVEVRDAHVRPVVARHELHRLERADSRDPDRRVRPLDASRAWGGGLRTTASFPSLVWRARIEATRFGDGMRP